MQTIFKILAKSSRGLGTSMKFRVFRRKAGLFPDEI